MLLLKILAILNQMLFADVSARFVGSDLTKNAEVICHIYGEKINGKFNPYSTTGMLTVKKNPKLKSNLKLNIYSDLQGTLFKSHDVEYVESSVFLIYRGEHEQIELSAHTGAVRMNNDVVDGYIGVLTDKTSVTKHIYSIQCIDPKVRHIDSEDFED